MRLGIACMRKAAKKVGKVCSKAERALRCYRAWTNDLPLDECAVLLEQQNGRTLDGSIYHVLKELLRKEVYPNLRVRLVVTEDAHDDAVAELDRRGVRVEMVKRGSKKYYRALATSKFLFVDNTLPPCFVKRPGQVLTNTWHGIPLKTLGRKEATSAPFIGNVQRCLALADYLLMPNPTMEHVMVRDYMLQGICRACVLPLGYPRNEPFVRPHHGEQGKRSYAWLPTFRMDAAARRSTPQAIGDLLAELDKELRDDETLYFRPHPIVADCFDLSGLTHVRAFPVGVEAYEFLSTCDVLVTDYSSVLFDFPLGGGKVVLVPFDKDAYERDRGLYQSMDELPFPQATDVVTLLRELRSQKAYDDVESLRAWWPYPTGGAAHALCQRVLGDGAPLGGEHVVESPPRPTALIYSELSCDLDALRAELQSLAKTHAVRLAFPKECGQDKGTFLASLPQEVSFTPMQASPALALRERVALAALWRKPGVVAARWVHDALEFERRRLLGEARFDVVAIHDGAKCRWLALMGSM